MLLPALPADVLLLRFWLALARQCQHVFLKAEIYVVAGDTGQFGGHDDAVFAKPNVDRRDRGLP